MVSIPACHAVDPGSIPGRGEAFKKLEFVADSVIPCVGEAAYSGWFETNLGVRALVLS